MHLDAPLDRLPLLARAGAVVPTEEDGVLVLHVVPPTAGSAVGGRLFSDDGDGWAPGRTDTWTWDGDLLRWSSDDVRPLPYERVVVRVHGAAAALEVDGAARPASRGDVDTGVFRTLRLIG